jgi:hypothetical protein
MKIKLVSSLILALALLVLGSPVYAIPALPHAFYGSVLINGNPAPDGTLISATVAEGATLTTSQNPVKTVGDSYGINSLRLLVQGDGLSGAITFYVNGVEAEGQTATFETGGGPTPRALSVTIASPAPSGPTGAGGPTGPPEPPGPPGVIIEEGFPISSEGEILKTVTVISADGNLTITIPEGTIALDKDGKPLEFLKTAVDESPPDPPEDAYIIGLAYDFGPEGATFDPSITIEYTYDPDEVPEGVAEEDLVIAFYDEKLKEWVELPCTVDTETHTITATVSHFTCFAIIGAPKPAAFALSSLVISPTEVAPGEKVSISVSVANTGGLEGSYTVVLKINGVKEAEQSVTIAASASKTVTFIVAKEEAGSYSVTADGMSGSFVVVTPVIALPPAPPNYWPLIGGLIAAAVIVGLLIYFLVVRRRAY